MRSLTPLVLLSAAVAVSARPQAHKDDSGLRKRVVDLESFRLKATAEYINAPAVDADTSIRAMARGADYVSTATDLVKKNALGAEFRVVDDHYVGTNGVAHVNFKQTVHGLDVDNADFNVNIAADGTVFSYGNNFFTGTIPAENPLKARAMSDPVHALSGATSILQLPISGDATAEETGDKEQYTLKGTSGAVSDPVARLVYFVKEDKSLVLTWRVETDIMDDWLLSYVDAETNKEVHGVVNYVAHATYQVYPWGLNDPTEGSRQVLTDPWDKSASPFTWIGDGSTTYNTTRGNNGIAQSNPSGTSSYLDKYRPASASLQFEYPYSPSSTPPSSYADASVTQLFYTANTYHDLLYTLGFTEAAGNFQTNNDGKGGKGSDFVILSAQDGAGTNNADFSTPPDGQNGRMRMYIWNRSTPSRDCVFEAGVVIHEYTHGLSNRLTGGPANSNCLNALESGGMGEGWGDFMATAVRLKAGDTAARDYPMGAWVYNDPKGIRDYPYSTSRATNPYTYTSVDAMSEVHAVGAVWATMLYELLWELVARRGKNDAPRPTLDARGVPTDGKYLAMKLVVDGMALQPCNPNFVQARDAILDADTALTGGANRCGIWTAFAKRGLGSGAAYSSSKRTGSTAIPSGVC